MNAARLEETVDNIATFYRSIARQRLSKHYPKYGNIGETGVSMCLCQATTELAYGIRFYATDR
jgi:hypothetical protein